MKKRIHYYWKKIIRTATLKKLFPHKAKKNIYLTGTIKTEDNKRFIEITGNNSDKEYRAPRTDFFFNNEEVAIGKLYWSNNRTVSRMFVNINDPEESITFCKRSALKRDFPIFIQNPIIFINLFFLFNFLLLSFSTLMYGLDNKNFMPAIVKLASLESVITLYIFLSYFIIKKYLLTNWNELFLKPLLFHFNILLFCSLFLLFSAIAFSQQNCIIINSILYIAISIYSTTVYKPKVKATIAIFNIHINELKCKLIKKATEYKNQLTNENKDIIDHNSSKAETNNEIIVTPDKTYTKENPNITINITANTQNVDNSDKRNQEVNIGTMEASTEINNTTVEYNQEQTISVSELDNSAKDIFNDNSDHSKTTTVHNDYHSSNNTSTSNTSDEKHTNKQDNPKSLKPDSQEDTKNWSQWMTLKEACNYSLTLKSNYKIKDFIDKYSDSFECEHRSKYRFDRNFPEFSNFP